MSKGPNGHACPHCDAPTKVYVSRSVGRTYRESHLRCTDAECGATYGASSEITHMIRPSGKPRKGLELRTAPPRRPANDPMPPHDTSGPEVPLPANDQQPDDAALA